MIDSWKEVEFDIHPAMDFATLFRAQGINIAWSREDAGKG
jgi:hypothetical protein